jgi:hypothetical protein
MFQHLRSRLRVSPAGVLATVALVFALTGGAYAAGRYVITSTKQIKPSVLKSLKGNAGPAGRAGAPGAAGPAGPTGPTGPAGSQGSEGKQGNEGHEGKQGPEGKPGEKGATGSPWTAGGTLPKGSTETGTWFAGVNAELVGFDSISFSIPLAATLDEEHVHYVTLKQVAEKAAPSQCPGSSTTPAAHEGNLCIYEGELSNPQNGTAEVIVEDPSIAAQGSATAGAALVVVAKEKESTFWGSWAVTG